MFAHQILIFSKSLIEATYNVFKGKLFSFHWSKGGSHLILKRWKWDIKMFFSKCFSEDGRPDKCLTFLLEKCWRRWLSRALNCCSMPPCPYFCRYAAQLTFVAGSFWSRIHPTPKSGFDAFGELEMRCCCWRHFYHFWVGVWVVCGAENRISHLLPKDPQVAREGQTENIPGSKVNCQALYKLVRTKG